MRFVAPSSSRLATPPKSTFISGPAEVTAIRSHFPPATCPRCRRRPRARNDTIRVRSRHLSAAMLRRESMRGSVEHYADGNCRQDQPSAIRFSGEHGLAMGSDNKESNDAGQRNQCHNGNDQPREQILHPAVVLSLEHRIHVTRRPSPVEPLVRAQHDSLPPVQLYHRAGSSLVRLNSFQKPSLRQASKSLRDGARIERFEFGKPGDHQLAHSIVAAQLLPEKPTALR